jgi:hypothetical protein
MSVPFWSLNPSAWRRPDQPEVPRRFFMPFFCVSFADDRTSGGADLWRFR